MKGRKKGPSVRLDTVEEPMCHICGEPAVLQIEGEGWLCAPCRRLGVLVTEPIRHLDGAVCDLIGEVVTLQAAVASLEDGLPNEERRKL